jgi:hypothetical protein
MRTHTLGAILVAVSAVVFPEAQEQQDHHLHSSASPLSRLTLRQIEEVRTSTAKLATTDAAKDAGYSPVLGWIPMMGTHWVHGQRMMQGKGAVTLAGPSQLMFSQVNGKETLVGAAFAYYSDISDKTQPVLFDSVPAWHDHPDLAPPGVNMHMLHVWFVDSPDGPFAGLNPYLPFWAAGVVPPDVARMRDGAFSARVRKAALALAEIVAPEGLFPILARRAGPRAVLDERRPKILAAVVPLNTSQAAKNWQLWDTLVDELGRHFDAIRDAYVTSALDPAVKARINKALDDMIRGGHGH